MYVKVLIVSKLLCSISPRLFDTSTRLFRPFSPIFLIWSLLESFTLQIIHSGDDIMSSYFKPVVRSSLSWHVVGAIVAASRVLHVSAIFPVFAVILYLSLFN